MLIRGTIAAQQALAIGLANLANRLGYPPPDTAAILNRLSHSEDDHSGVGRERRLAHDKLGG